MQSEIKFYFVQFENGYMNSIASVNYLSDFDIV